MSCLPLSCKPRRDIITAHLSSLGFLLGYFLLEINACQCACEISWGSRLNGAVKTATVLVSGSNPALFPESCSMEGWGAHTHQLLLSPIRWCHCSANTCMEMKRSGEKRAWILSCVDAGHQEGLSSSALNKKVWNGGRGVIASSCCTYRWPHLFIHMGNSRITPFLSLLTSHHLTLLCMWEALFEIPIIAASRTVSRGQLVRAPQCWLP